MICVAMSVRLLLALALVMLSSVTIAAPKYVFLFIGDGMSTPQRMVADEFARKIGYGPLLMNELPYQSNTRTYSADSLVTDSAASATAIACGEKAENGALGMAPGGVRLESVAEFAKKQGMRVGIMTTVTITHATPAGFYAHRRSRSEVYRIGLDLVNSGFDYFAGGGMSGEENNRNDGDYRGNIFDLAREAGYNVITDVGMFNALRPGCGKVWNIFTNGSYDFAVDKIPGQPPLAEMVRKAIELLDGPQGFFIMAEGGKVDYCAHANDAATTLREVIALDNAVKVAADFLEKHPDETLVITTGDHETGGMAMGFAGTGYNLYVELLARQKVSCERFSGLIAKMIKDNPKIVFADVRGLLEESFGFVFEPRPNMTREDELMLLSKEEIARLKKAFREDVRFVMDGERETTAHDVQRRKTFAATARRIMSNHAGVGWSSGAHTALPTMTTAKGAGAERFIGFLENYDIARRIKELIRK